MSYEEADKLERDGKYADAAMEYAMCGFENLLETDFRPCRLYRIGLAHFLQAISCDARARNDTRANGLCEITTLLFQVAKNENPSDVLSGLYNEWTGDALFMAGNSDARSYYQQSLKQYDSIDRTERSWWMEEEYQYTLWAFEAFISHHGKEYPNDNSLDWDFTNRVQFKLGCVDDVLSDTDP